MKKAIPLALLLSLSLVLSSRTPGAASAQQEQLYEITSPRPNAQLRGSVEIIGTARLGPDFQFYKVEYAPAARPGDWVTIGDVHREQRTNQPLEIWHTSSLQDGSYYLHLVIVRQDYSYVQTEPLPVEIINTRPQPTATPEETLTPTSTIVMPTPTPAIVEQPTVVRSSQTAVSGQVATPAPAQDVREGITIPDLGVYVRQFLFGAFVAMAIFLLVGVIALLRRLI